MPINGALSGTLNRIETDLQFRKIGIVYTHSGRMSLSTKSKVARERDFWRGVLLPFLDLCTPCQLLPSTLERQCGQWSCDETAAAAAAHHQG